MSSTVLHIKKPVNHQAEPVLLLMPPLIPINSLQKTQPPMYLKQEDRREFVPEQHKMPTSPLCLHTGALSSPTMSNHQQLTVYVGPQICHQPTMVDNYFYEVRFKHSSRFSLLPLIRSPQSCHQMINLCLEIMFLLKPIVELTSVMLSISLLDRKFFKIPKMKKWLSAKL